MVWVEFASSSTCLESRLITLDFESEVLGVVRNLCLGIIIGTGLAVGINCLCAKLSAVARRLHSEEGFDCDVGGWCTHCNVKRD